jgi:hypothetical protein
MHGISLGAPGSAAPGDATLALGYLGIVGPGLSRLLLLGSPGFLFPPIDWRWVDGDAEFACSQVTAKEVLCFTRHWLRSTRTSCVFFRLD